MVLIYLISFLFLEHVMAEYNIKVGDIRYEKLLMRMKNLTGDARKRMKRMNARNNVSQIEDRNEGHMDN